MESLLEEQYLNEIKEFYKPYFDSMQEVEKFIKNTFKLDWDDRKPRQMIFQVQRFVTLANEIDKIRPARDGLRILFLKCCMESLATLSGIKNNVFSSEFASSFSDKGKKYILSNFSLSYYTYEIKGREHEESYDLTMDDFLQIIKAMRNMVVHDGNYWEMQIFAYDEESVWLTHLETDLKILPENVFNYKDKLTTYHFETTLQYEKFIYYFVEACIKFINSYIDKTEEKQ